MMLIPKEKKKEPNSSIEHVVKTLGCEPGCKLGCELGCKLGLDKGSNDG